jgi:hypothetical protein
VTPSLPFFLPWVSVWDKSSHISSDSGNSDRSYSDSSIVTVAIGAETIVTAAVVAAVSTALDIRGHHLFCSSGLIEALTFCPELLSQPL